MPVIGQSMSSIAGAMELHANQAGWNFHLRRPLAVVMAYLRGLAGLNQLSLIDAGYLSAC